MRETVVECLGGLGIACVIECINVQRRDEETENVSGRTNEPKPTSRHIN
jgi:hypothetical protein